MPGVDTKKEKVLYKVFFSEEKKSVAAITAQEVSVIEQRVHRLALHPGGDQLGELVQLAAAQHNVVEDVAGVVVAQGHVGAELNQRQHRAPGGPGAGEQQRRAALLVHQTGVGALVEENRN